MTKKEIFITEIDEIIENVRKTTGECPLSEDALMYFNALKSGGDGKERPAFTDNGKIILKYMQDNFERCDNMFKAKDFEGAGISSRTASGSLRKLTSDGYVEKIPSTPVIYMITESGKSINVED